MVADVVSSSVYYSRRIIPWIVIISIGVQMAVERSERLRSIHQSINPSILGRFPMNRYIAVSTERLAYLEDMLKARSRSRNARVRPGRKDPTHSEHGEKYLMVGGVSVQPRLISGGFGSLVRRPRR